MGCVLEAGKLVTASWLYHNWSLAPALLKIYLTSAVIVLMFITSMGIFGFLSKAHIDQTVLLNSGNADTVKVVESKLQFEKASVADLDKQISQIDAAIDKLTDRGQASTSLKAADTQRKTRDALSAKKQAHVDIISQLTQQKIKLDTDVRKAEAEVGPIKYIANMVYDNADGDQLEKAVRWVILILVTVFDPLAVILLIAANVGLQAKRPPPPVLIPPVEKHKVFHIDDNIWTNGTEIRTQEKTTTPTADSISSTDSIASI